jgi:hypothetical protein
MPITSGALITLNTPISGHFMDDADWRLCWAPRALEAVRCS